MISQQKIKEWVDLYLKHIEEITPAVHVNKEEGYKFKAVDTFQKNFNIDAPNFAEMIGRSIEQNNLVAGSMYLPRKTLLSFAEAYESEVRGALKILFDESIDIAKRINETRNIFNNLQQKVNKKLGRILHSYIGLRFLSLLLAFRYPNSINAIKPSEWKVFCGYIDDSFNIPNHTSHGEQYSKYNECIEALRSYIKTIPEIKSLKDQLTKGLDFQDEEYRWMTQDIIYVTARIREVDAEPVVTSEPVLASDMEEDGGEPLTIQNRFALEEDLQHFIGENFGSIDLGESLNLYKDRTGRSGLYYPASGVGEIDVLAVDVDGNYVVIELKRDKAADAVAAQLGRYMQWVDDNMARKEGKNVRGMIIAHRSNRSILDSVRALRFPVKIKYYKIKLDLVDL